MSIGNVFVNNGIQAMRLPMDVRLPERATQHQPER